jgi:hypothetical protein
MESLRITRAADLRSRSLRFGRPRMLSGSQEIFRCGEFVSRGKYFLGRRNSSERLVGSRIPRAHDNKGLAQTLWGWPVWGEEWGFLRFPI